MFLRAILSLVFCICAWTVSAFEITNRWVIVVPGDASESEKFAASEIQDYIRKATGMELKIAKEGSPAILVRPGKFEPEEWLVKREKNGDILITGGRPRGVLYGAYEFIEKGLGCRFLAADAESVPKLEKLNLPDDFKLAGNPVFTRRYIYVGNGDVWQYLQPFMSKLKQNGLPAGEQYGFSFKYGTPGACHTYYAYSKDFSKDKEEYFTLSSDGKRLRAISGIGPGQVCLAHPEVRRLFLENLRSFIALDRKNLKPGEPAPMIYAVSKNDNSDDCVCGNCLALKQKFGGKQSGVMLDFTNWLANEIQKDYPGIKLLTPAYTTTEDIPTGIKPSKNVVIEIAQLDSEFTTNVKRDVLRPLDHPNNAKALAKFSEWGALTNDISVWDYWVLYRDHHVSPYTNVSSIPVNLRTYEKLGIRNYFVESEIEPYAMPNFIDLRHYLGAKLMVDPSLNEKEIIDDFMNHFYGPAAKPMKAYLDYLEGRMKEENRPLGSIAPSARKYLDRQFLLDAKKFFSAAEKAAGNDPVLLKRIGQERIPVDVCLLNFGKRLNLQFDRESVLKRLRANYDNYVEKYVLPAKRDAWKKEIGGKIDTWSSKLPLPPQFEQKKAYDFTANSFTFSPVQQKVDDPEAAGGSALMLSDLKKLGKETPADFHKKPLEFFVYDNGAKKTIFRSVVDKDKQASDEKYHWYRVGKTKLSPSTRFVIHPSWWISQNIGNSVFDPLEPELQYEIWASVKLTGPSYAPGSGKPDAIYLDRVIYVAD